MSLNSASGRSLVAVLIVAVLAVVAVVVLFLADPFGMVGDGVTRNDDPFAPDDLGALDRGAGDGDEGSSGISLAGRYGEGDLGAIRLRLLNIEGKQPFADQPLSLFARSGDERTVSSGVDGVAVFATLPPARGYRLEIGGEGHAPVTILGVNVSRGETTDLGDIMLGQNVVLRGRVVDGTGQALPGSAVAVYTPGGSMLADGFLVGMVKQATTFPAPVEKVLSDDEGWFSLSTLDDGVYRMEVRHSGYATRYETDVVVSRDRSAKNLKIVLGEGATLTGTVRDERGQPVDNARVVAIKDNGRRFGGGSTTLERDVTSTDRAGQYVIDTLTQGTSYRFGVMAEGYAPVFEMQAEEIRGRTHQRDFELVLGGAIAGVVTQKEDGKPVEGASVIVAVGQMPFGRRGGGGGEEMRTSTGQARTDADGRFLIEGIRPGPVLSAQVKASGYVPFNASQFMGGTGWGEVVAEDTLEVTAELEQGGVIEGTVLDRESREPVAGAQVTVIPRQMPWMVFVSGAPQAVTDGAGKYVLSGVQPGEYGVSAFAAGYAPSDAQNEANAASLEAVGGVVTKDVTLSRAGWVTGVVTDSIGEPVAGARVRTRRAPQPRGEGGRGGRGGRGRMRSFLPGGTSADLTDQDGRFRIDDVPAETRWLLVADADDFVEVESEPFQVRAGEEKEVDVVMVGGGNVEGRVTDDRGSVVANARVQVGRIPANRSNTRLVAWEVDRYLEPEVHFTDEEGRFRATNIPPGIGVVKVELEGYVTHYRRNLVIRSDDTVSNYNITMAKGDVMRGVVKSQSGQPVQGAMVAVTKRTMGEDEGEGEEPTEEETEEIEPRLSGRTDEQGRFEIENIPPGVYNVVVWFAPGYQGYGREQNESAIKRGLVSDAGNVEFRLEPQAAGQPGMPGRPGGSNR